MPFSVLTVSLSLGAVVVNITLCYVAHLLERNGAGISQHFFVAERNPPQKTLADRIMGGYSAIVFRIAPALIGCCVLWEIYLLAAKLFSLGQLIRMVSYLQNICSVMLPISISVTIFLFSIRKSYQTFFTHNNCIQRYRRSFQLLIGCWGISTALGLLVASNVVATSLQLYVLTAELLLLTTAFLLSLYVTWVTIKLSFAARPVDVVQFKKFGLHRHDSSWTLWTCNYPGSQELAFSEKHLIMDLQKQTERFEKHLKRHCHVQKVCDLQVTFTDITYMRSAWYKCFSIVVWLLMMWSAFGIFCGVLVFSQINVPSLISDRNLSFLALSVLFLCLAFFLRTGSCYQIAAYNTYGSWGYCFADPAASKVRYFFSERQFLFSPGKNLLRAIWRILALFRIEVVQSDAVSYSRFLSELKTAANMLPGFQSDVLKVTYCLCCRLGQFECRERSEIFQELVLSTFAKQLCHAIWTDHTRCTSPSIEAAQQL